jgi:hypothetical protein
MYPIRTLLKAADGRQMRVIDVLPATGELVTIDTQSANAKPQVWPAAELEATAKAQRWVRMAGVASKTDGALAVPTKLTHAALQLRTARWNIVQRSLRDERLYRRETRQPAVDEIAAEHNVSALHVRQLLRMAWQGGMTPEALTPGLHHCGRNVHDGKPRGRKPTHADYEPYVWTPELRAKAAAMVRSMYLEDSTVSLQEVYDKFIRKHYSFVDPDGVIRQVPLGERPTERQLRSVLEAELTDSERHAARHSVADYDNNWAPTIGHVLQDCQGAGDVYEIDASQVDVWLVAREDGRTIIGKATMYLVVDRFSRLIVGYYVSLDAPSWSGATQAILSIFADKRELCRRANVPYDEADWPAHGLMPQRFFGDRGEMVSQASDSIAEGLHTTVTNARALWSAGKGLVECTFKLVHVPMKRLRAGYEPARNTKIRRGKKYYRDAKMTLDQLRHQMLRIVVDHNRKAHTTYKLPACEIRAGYQPIPREVFTRSVRTHMGLLSHYEEQDVRFNLLLDGRATVTQDGISLGECLYTAPEAIKRDWFTQAAKRGHFTVQVRENPGLVDGIYVIDPMDPSRYFLAELTDYCAQFKGYTRAEVASLTAHGKGNDVEGKEGNLTLRMNKAAADERAGLTTKGKPAIRRKVLGPAARTADARVDRSVSQAMPSPTAAPAGDSANRPPPVPSTPELADAPAHAPTLNEAAPEPVGMKASVLNKLFDGNDDDLE